jgi:hypothetical protein
LSEAEQAQQAKSLSSSQKPPSSDERVGSRFVKNKQSLGFIGASSAQPTHSSNKVGLLLLLDPLKP